MDLTGQIDMVDTAARSIKHQTRNNDGSYEDAVDLGALLLVILRGWWIVLATILLALGVVYYSITHFTPVYTARMIVVPSGGNQSSIKGLPSQLGVIESIFGSSGREADTFSRFRATLGSVVLAKRLDEKHGYLHRVYNGLWNEDLGVWVRPDDWRSNLFAFTARMVHAPEWVPPSVQDLASFAASRIKVSEMKESEGVYEISLTYPDKNLALEFLTDAVQEAEQLIKDEDRRNTSANISYLRNQIRDVNIADYRSSLIQVLAQEEKKMMALAADLPYAARIIDRPNVSERSTVPNLLLFLIMAVGGGALVGTVIVIGIHLIRLAVRRERLSTI